MAVSRITAFITPHPTTAMTSTIQQIPAIRRRPVTPPQREPIAERTYTRATAVAIGLGFLIRCVLVLRQDFPLNDGGLFYLMVRELQSAHYHLPAFTSYNSAGIPFAYSPLSFYVAGAVNQVTGISLLDVFRFLPLFVTSLTVVAFYLLARAMIRSRATVLAAVLAFAVLPRSYIWLLMGGGLTRSFGFLFAILSLHSAFLLYTKRQWRYAATLTLFTTLTVLSHLGTAPFTAFSIALLFLFYGRHRHGMIASAAVVAGTIVLSAPWWLTVMGTHGIAPFLAASATGGSLFGDAGVRNHVLVSVARFGMGTGEPLFPLVGVLAVIGVLPSLTRERCILPVWWLTITLLEARAGATYSTLPVALLAGIAVTDVLLPVLRGRSVWSLALGDRRVAGRPLMTPVLPLRRRHVEWRAWAVLGIFLTYGAVCALLTTPELGSEGRWLSSLSKDERDVMTWVSQRTPPNSRFLIVSGASWGGWWADRVSEWFPVLADRPSVATVQGYEWLPGETYSHRWGEYDAAQRCSGWTAPCLDDWSKATGREFTHVLLTRNPEAPCCDQLLASLRNDKRYELLFDGPGGVIFVRRQGDRLQSRADSVREPADTGGAGPSPLTAPTVAH